MGNISCLDKRKDEGLWEQEPRGRFIIIYLPVCRSSLIHILLYDWGTRGVFRFIL